MWGAVNKENAGNGYTRAYAESPASKAFKPSKVPGALCWQVRMPKVHLSFSRDPGIQENSGEFGSAALCPLSVSFPKMTGIVASFFQVRYLASFRAFPQCAMMAGMSTRSPLSFPQTKTRAQWSGTILRLDGDEEEDRLYLVHVDSDVVRHRQGGKLSSL